MRTNIVIEDRLIQQAMRATGLSTKRAVVEAGLKLLVQVKAQTGTHYTVRQASYDLRKLRGKHLVTKPGRSHRYHVPPEGARTLAALIGLRDHVIAPVLAGVRKPTGRPPKTYTRIDHDYDTIRAGLRTLFTDLGIQAAA